MVRLGVGQLNDPPKKIRLNYIFEYFHENNLVNVMVLIADLMCLSAQNGARGT